ncbi:ABC transporter substrate-binding protein [Microbacterium sp. X-17]|uniref:ABC transporter substrate-binding protein n=1 Tax=Microbacterium sp. X-17 TaxID=3144404 RepID=UPI0031F595F9
MTTRTSARRRALRLATAATAAIALALLAGCSAGSSTTTGPTPPPFLSSSGDGTPVKGGELRVGVISGGPAESVNPGVTSTYGDHARVLSIYDRLFEQKIDNPGTTDFSISYAPSLATAATSNADATLWTITLRSGVLWQDGSPFTAADVVWAIQNVWSDQRDSMYAYATTTIDIPNVHATDPLTVVIPMKMGTAEFPSLLTMSGASITKNGESFDDLSAHPMGTGPFEVSSFSPGDRTELVANPHYWQPGKPYLDKVTLVSFTDEGARSNALLSGSIDAAPNYSFSLAAANLNNPAVKILNVPSGGTHYIYVNLEQAPYNDPRLVEALKLLVDRQTMIQNVFNGFATESNDLLGLGTQYYDSSSTRSYDPDKARQLIKDAGLENAKLEITTAPAIAGFVEAATLFAEQARAVGLDVNVKQVDPSTYFTTAGGWLSLPMGQDQTLAFPSLTAYYLTFFTPTAYADETHWGASHPDSAPAMLQAMSATDPTTANSMWAAVQKQQFDQGGVIGVGNANEVDAVAPNVRGLTATGSSVALNNFRFQDAWITQ